MIIIKLLGGLGNQMFQYAMAKRLALLNNTTIKFDLRGLFAGEDVRTTYELDIFGIQHETVAEKEYFNYYRKSYLGSKILWEFLVKLNKIQTLKDADFVFHPEFLTNLSKNTMLRGLFQSEKYFVDIRSEILETFKFNQPSDKKNGLLIDKIKNESAVSVHFRMGEFLKNKVINQNIGVCSPDYFYSAIEYISVKTENPVFYFFSDTPEWIKENIRINYPFTIIDWNTGKESYRDMQLMSLCKHNIIANSTFSWWGAWLNQNPDKMVIAPKKWFSGWDYDTKDLIPDNWMRL